MPESADRVKPTVAEMVIAAVLALAFSLGANYAADTTFDFSAVFVLQAATLFILFCVFFRGAALLARFVWRRDKQASEKGATGVAGMLNSLAKRVSEIPVLKLVAIVALVLLAFWLPYLIALYPGNLSNDTTGQLVSFFSFVNGDGLLPISNHHPVTDTLAFGVIVYPFYAAGNFQLGLFVCVLMQMVLTCLSFATVLAIALRRWKAPAVLVAVVFAVLALCPLFPILVCGLSKDTFFSWVYLLWLALIFDAVAAPKLPLDKAAAGDAPPTPKPLITQKPGLAMFLILCILVVLTKKLGVYIALAALVCLAVATIRNKPLCGRFVAGVLCVAAANWVVAPLIVGALGALPAERVDMFSVPVQQTALSMTRHPDEYDERDRVVANIVVDLSKLEGYDPRNTDTVKQLWAVPPADGSAGLWDYVALWARMGMAHPEDYADAWLALASPLLTPTTIFPLFDSSWHTQNDDYLPESSFEKPAFATAASQHMEEWYYWLAGLPVVGVLFMQPFYALALPALLLCGMLAARRRLGWKVVAAFVPVLVSIAGLAVSPMLIPHFETMRYLLPFVYTAPLIVLFSGSVLASD